MREGRKKRIHLVRWDGDSHGTGKSREIHIKPRGSTLAPEEQREVRGRQARKRGICPTVLRPREGK